jgi:acyl-CoA thioester hydrolase
VAPYVNDVAVRWSDQDAYGHVNHARVVTLLEDARTAMLFDAATKAGVEDFAGGLLVAALDVAYKRPIVWSPTGVRVEMTAQDVRAASFRVAYRLLLPDGDGDWDGAKPAVTATTQLVPYDLTSERPRRLTPVEREFLASYTGDEAQRSSTIGTS